MTKTIGLLLLKKDFNLANSSYSGYYREKQIGKIVRLTSTPDLTQYYQMFPLSVLRK